MQCKKIMVFLICIPLFLLHLCACDLVKTNQYDEGTAEFQSEALWTDNEDQMHYAKSFTNGNTANRVLKESQDITLHHMLIDDISIYEMYIENENTGKMVFFFHGQGSRKEEYLYEMVNYAEAGYLCVTVDLDGHGERIKDETIMSVQITVNTAKDIDTLLDYYETIPYADTKCFALVGFSQGGSISYWYAAFGERIPTAMIIGSSSPDYKYQNDNTALCNGKFVDAAWNKDELSAYIDENNPINNAERLVNIPIMSGNGLEDKEISYKGAEELEKIITESGNTNSRFYYFEGIGHEVTEDFMSHMIPFLNNNM